MAQIYQKGSEKALVLAPREAVIRKFNFGSDWTDVRMGIYCSAVAATGPNDTNVTEILAPSSVNDYLTFGIKDDSETNPGQSGSLFLGVRQGSDTNISSAPEAGIGGLAFTYSAVGYNGVTQIRDGSVSGHGMGEGIAASASGYASFFGIRIVINNRGLSTQTVDVYLESSAALIGTNYSASALRAYINAITWGSPIGNVAWNNGSIAYDIPNCFWLRVPTFDNAMRLSAIRIIRFAP